MTFFYPPFPLNWVLNIEYLAATVIRSPYNLGQITDIKTLIFIIVAYAILGSPLEMNCPSDVTSLNFPSMLFLETRTLESKR